MHEVFLGISYQFNLGAQIDGSILTSMKDLRGPEKIIRPDADQDGVSEPFYRVMKYKLIPVVEGRNLRYETMMKKEVREIGQISIASAFRPGTN